MAFSTGTVSNASELYDALATFIGSNGWTLLDSISARDKVYRSNGADGRRDMIYRLTLNSEPGFPIVAPDHPQRAVPTIVVRGYLTWDLETHTGTGEFGQFGPWVVTANASNPFIYYRVESDSYPIPRATQADGPWAPASSSDFDVGFSGFSGGRGVFTGYQAALHYYDLITGDKPYTHALGYNMAGRGCLVFDHSSHKTYLYTLTVNATTSGQFLRHCIEDGLTATLESPFPGANPNGGALIWDGADYIYAIRGGSNHLSRYSISENAWVSLAPAPVSRAGHHQWTASILYVPASVTGYSEDVIYMFLANTGTTLYRYNVSSNTWGPNITLPNALTTSHRLYWDGERHLYYMNLGVGSSSPSAWRSDLRTDPGDFTLLGGLNLAARTNSTASYLFNHFASRLRASDRLLQTFWCVGDADGMVFVNRVDTADGPRYYWMGFGVYATNRRGAIMTTTAPISSGALRAIPVDGTSGYRVGDEVTVYDPGQGIMERSTIQGVPDGSTVVLSLLNSYGAGTRIGMDPFQHGLFGDTNVFIAPTNGLLPRRRDLESDHYFLASTLPPKAIARGNPSSLGVFTPVPTLIYYDLAYTSRYENLGTLYQVCMHPQAAYPGLQPGETVSTEIGTYMFFVPDEANLFTNDKLGILVGPID